jgi:hypothetical protein
MAITLNGTTGITTPANTSTGNDTVAGTLQVGGITTNVYPLVSSTAVASTSGTSIDFTSIPSWAKRITVMFNGVSTSGTSNHLVQLGTGSTTFTTSGYASSGSTVVTTAGTVTSTAGFIQYTDTAAFTVSGHMLITNVSGNVWVSSHICKNTTTSTCMGGGDITLAAALTAVRITTVNGTDTFDAGSVNILYE